MTEPPRMPAHPPLAPPPPVVPSPWDRAAIPTGPEPAPPPRPSRQWLALVAVLAVVALVAIAVAVAATRDDDSSAAPGTTASPTTEGNGNGGTGGASTTSTTASAQSFDEVVQQVEDFVERARGLKFKQPVTVDLEDDAAFKQKLLDGFDEQVPQLESFGNLLKALGMIDPGTDVVAQERDLLAAGVVGFYDPHTDKLVVRGTSTSPYVRITMAHELTHALDDQWFELDRPALDKATDESGYGFTALVEGNARRIEDMYRDSLSATEQAQAQVEELQLVSGIDVLSFPPVLVDRLVAPYTYGPDLVAAILAHGGQAELDHDFTAPPTTSEQFLDPPVYLSGEGAKAVTPPTADGPVVDHGSFGAFMLRELLDPVVDSDEVSQAVQGWGGDAYVTWASSGATCVRIAFAGDSEGDTAEITQALSDWALSRSGANVAPGAGGTVMITSCG